MCFTCPLACKRKGFLLILLASTQPHIHHGLCNIESGGIILFFLTVLGLNLVLQFEHFALDSLRPSPTVEAGNRY